MIRELPVQAPRKTREAYPSYPSTALFAKDDAPCGLEGLKILVWLEEGSDGQGVEDAECDEEEQYILRGS